jgi:hypothetical protein
MITPVQYVCCDSSWSDTTKLSCLHRLQRRETLRCCEADRSRMRTACHCEYHLLQMDHLQASRVPEVASSRIASAPLQRIEDDRTDRYRYSLVCCLFALSGVPENILQNGTCQASGFS